MVDRAVGAGDVALDIGANLGLVSLRLAARVGPGGQVHAFEPQPRMLGYLRKTLEMNPDLPVTLHPVALGAEEARLSMAVPEHNAGAASLNNAIDMAGRPGVAMIDVPVHRLSDYAEKQSLTRVDFIKMDVEGFEPHVIEGGMALLRQTRPKVIILEENSPDPTTGLSPALRMLKELDYELYALPRQMLSVRLYPLSARKPAHDYVAVSRSAPAEIRQALGV